MVREPILSKFYGIALFFVFNLSLSSPSMGSSCAVFFQNPVSEGTRLGMEMRVKARRSLFDEQIPGPNEIWVFSVKGLEQWQMVNSIFGEIQLLFSLREGSFEGMRPVFEFNERLLREEGIYQVDAVGFEVTILRSSRDFNFYEEFLERLDLPYQINVK